MKPRGWRREDKLDQILAGVASSTRRRFPNLRRSHLAVTLVIPNRGHAIGGSSRGDELWYPASVVKLFYMTAIEAWLERGLLKSGAELRGALAAMIHQSSNDATNHIVDLLSGTTSGPVLVQSAFAKWLTRRRAVNRYFATWRCPEFAGMNLTQKTWGDAPYGREHQARFVVPNNQNALSTDSIARLLLAIERGEAINRRRSAAMLKLLARPIPARPDPKTPFDQVFGFLGEGLPKGSRLWSKAGWTSAVKHDTAIVRLPSGRRFILAVFTRGETAARSTRILPFIARRVAASVAALSM